MNELISTSRQTAAKEGRSLHANHSSTFHCPAYSWGECSVNTCMSISQAVNDFSVEPCASAVPKVEPKFKHITRYSTGRVQCSFGYPLADCQVRVSEHYYQRFDTLLDFRRGRQSPSVPLTEPEGDTRTTGTYFGGGLAEGHCGVQLDGVHSGVYLVECFGRREPGGWGQGFGLLTSSARSARDYDAPKDPLVIARRGSSQSVQLQSPTPWILCTIRTPSEGPLDLVPGQGVPPGRRYSKQGGDLERGGCGFQLPDVQDRDAGVWDWFAEDHNTAVWHMALVMIEEGPRGPPTLRLRNALPLREGDLLEAECLAPPASPPASITWLLQGEVVRDDELNDTRSLELAGRPWQPRPVLQTFTRRLAKADQGKLLQCRVEHATLAEPAIAQLTIGDIRSTPAVPKVEPKFQHIKRYSTGRVQCSFGYPLADCQVRVSEHYYQRFDTLLDFRRGRQSPSVPLTEPEGDTRTTGTYFGGGLAEGHCGVQLDGVHSGVYLVECFGRREPGGWGQGFGLLTSSARSVQPWDAPKHPLMVARRGSSQSVQLQSSRPWTLCTIRTPSEGPLDLGVGQGVPQGRRYRKQGGDLERGGCGFQLPDVQDRDAGVWDWFAEEPHSAVWHMAIMTIEEGPRGPPTLRLRNALPLREGDLLEAECRAPPASPPATISWLLQGEVVRDDQLNDTWSLELAGRPWQPRPVLQTFTRRLAKADQGKLLQCRLEHATLAQPAIAQLTIGDIGAMPKVVAEASVVRSAEGHLAELACLIDSQPPVSVRWLRDGVPVVESPLVVVGRSGTRHWLRLEDVVLEDFANFTCVADSPGGVASNVIELTGVPGKPRLAASSSGSSLAWTVESHAPLTGITLKIRRGKGSWLVVDAPLDEERVNLSTVLVRHEFEAREGGEHSAYLVAVNQFGASRASDVHSFLATPSADTPKTQSGGATCPALISTSVEIRCSKAGSAVRCTGPVPAGTTARFACRPGFRLPEPHPGQLQARCSSQGRWSRALFECIPDCGRRNGLGARPTVVGGKQALGAEFPWHAALFRQGKAFQAICGGTLVTPTLVVTAAHCVWDEANQTKMPESRFRVALGKHTRGWATSDAGEQRFRVSRLHVPQRYAGNVRRLENDIAVLRLAVPAVLTLAVNLACVDWEAEFEYQHFTSGSNGTVPGWGVDESNAPSDTLRYVDLPFVPFKECHDSVPDDFKAYITRDKICAGFQGRTTSVCAGDSGGGLVFPAQRSGGTRYFLRAVVSSAPLNRASSKACQSEHRTAFTALSAHAAWLKGVLFGRGDEGGVDARV